MFRRRQPAAILALALLVAGADGRAAGQAAVVAPASAPAIERARANGRQFEEAVAASRRLLHAWLKHADERTKLLPDRLDPDRGKWVYTPHNSGADLYPYLVLTAHLTDPDLYNGRMIEMLRNEIRFTSARASVPGNLTLATGELGPASLFGAGEYAKDGLVSVTEYLGRTPWFYRMVDMTADAMAQAPVQSRFGLLPASDTELNGDYLQTLIRLATMTGESRFLEWARRIGDVYVEEVLPGTFGVPGMKWDFTAHSGDRRLRLRDHGNETVVGLTLLLALEQQLGSDRVPRYRQAVERMLDRILQSARPDGMLYNEVDAETLAPLDSRLSDNWGYVYGAVYTYYQVSGETKYRDAVRRVLASLPSYRNYAWEPGRNPPLGSFDGYADSIESAIYLVNREPVAATLEWIRVGDARDARHAARRRSRRRLVRRRQLQSDGSALCLHEEPRRSARAVGTRSPPWFHSRRGSPPGVSHGSSAPRDPVRLRSSSPRAQSSAQPRPPERVPRMVHRR